MARKQKSAEAMSVDESKVATTTMVATEQEATNGGGDNSGSAPPVEQKSSSVPPTQVGDAGVKKVVGGGENQVLTPEAYRVWLKSLQYTDARYMQWTQLPLYVIGCVSSWVRHPLDVDELKVLAFNDGPEIESSVPNASGVRPVFQPVGVYQVDVENQENWPAHEGPLVPEDMEKICHRFHDRHPLGGKIVVLGNFFLLGYKPVPVEGFHWFGLKDRDTGRVRWVPNKVYPGKNGDALGKMRALLCEQENKEILPLSRELIEELNEVFALTNKARRERQQREREEVKVVDSGIADLLASLSGGGNDRRSDRGEKARFQGGGYRHPRRDDRR